MKNKIIKIVQILLIILFTISIVPKGFQNDTFFSIPIGQNILENGIETEEKLVWHENLEFTNSRWLFDVVIASIYNLFDLNGIYIFVIVVAAIQALLYYYILDKLTNKNSLAFIVTLITMYFSLYEFTGRAQIVSFTLFLLEFYFIEKLVETNKNRYFVGLLLIPIILVNYHASVFPICFVLYLPYIAEFILAKLNLKENNESKLIIANRNIKKIVVLIIATILLGFCTPKGLAPYTDMLKAMSKTATTIISELQPLDIMDSTYFIILCLMFLGLLSFTKTKIRITDFLYVLGFSVMAISTSRCIFFFYIIASVCIYRILVDCIDCYNVNFDFVSNKYKNILFGILTVFIILYSLKMISEKSYKDFINPQEYPVDCANYILNNLDVENIRIFNGFDFGSYLEFKGIPAFIDSRSGIYTSEFNEGCTILKDWHQVDYGYVFYQEIFDKYGITHALLENVECINVYISQDENWKQIYQDDNFSLYERIENNT